MSKIVDNIKEWTHKREKVRQERAEDFMRSKRLKEIADEDIDELRHKLQEIIEDLKRARNG